MILTVLLVMIRMIVTIVFSFQFSKIKPLGGIYNNR